MDRVWIMEANVSAALLILGVVKEKKPEWNQHRWPNRHLHHEDVMPHKESSFVCCDHGDVRQQSGGFRRLPQR